MEPSQTFCPSQRQKSLPGLIGSQDKTEETHSGTEGSNIEVS